MKMTACDGVVQFTLLTRVEIWLTGRAGRFLKFDILHTTKRQRNEMHPYGKYSKASAACPAHQHTCTVSGW